MGPSAILVEEFSISAIGRLGKFSHARENEFTSVTAYLSTFGKLKSGQLRCDVSKTIIAKRSLRGLSPRFSRGSGGMLPRKSLKIETVKYGFFNVLINDSTHL